MFFSLQLKKEKPDQYKAFNKKKSGNNNIMADKEYFDEVIRMTREIPQTEEETVIRAFGDIKEVISEIKKMLE